MVCVVLSHADCGPCRLEASIVVICDEGISDDEAHFRRWCGDGCWASVPRCIRYKNEASGVLIAVFIQLDIERLCFPGLEPLVALYMHTSEGEANIVLHGIDVGDDIRFWSQMICGFHEELA